MKWVIEENLNLSNERMATAARKAGHKVVRWDSQDDPIPKTADVFYGSLEACSKNMPGVIGNPDNLKVSTWMPLVMDIALNRENVVTRVRDEFKDIPESWDPVFIRPDSGMKPFSGRVLPRTAVNPRTLDYGYYYNDLDLQVIVSPVQTVSYEWRFVSVNRKLVACSGYDPTVHREKPHLPHSEVMRLAEEAARRSIEPTVVIDVGLLAGGGLKLIEYNLFSGSDFYCCDCDAIVQAMGA